MKKLEMSSQGQRTDTPEIAQPTPEELEDDHNHDLLDEVLKLMRAGIETMKAEQGPGQKRQWTVKRLRNFLKVMKKSLGEKSKPKDEAMAEHWDKIYYALFGRQSSECFGNLVFEWKEDLHDWNGHKALGVSEWKDGNTTLQIKMEPNAESEYQLLETFLHEMCHAVIWYTCCMGECGEATCKEMTKKWVHENDGHGYHWQTLADTLGEYVSVLLGEKIDLK